eukprot:NODE_10890_length_1322_cov_7.774895.p1 GENE.NODE_10890_length_1322_cov_7.774895~~NODE_10890_length_1322_cov_7.774895.p1  ORF type:complete len:264 (+),score=74.93 NODE_10890_length_1322_cov_7.774895:495-1286(+)
MLCDSLLDLGRRLDQTAGRLVPSTAPKEPTDAAETPEVFFHRRGVLVVCKPPGWEVDSVTNDTDAICLSEFLRSRFRARTFPLLHAAAHGFGFVHRLDVASSGLVLVGSTFEGLFALQWQKSLYEISRHYQVVSYDIAAAAHRTVEAKVNVLGTKISRTLTEDNGQPAVSHFLTQCHLAGFPARELCYCILVIRIYTGRRHQIRAHTRLMGHPTACDGWYSPSAVTLRGVNQHGPTPSRQWVRTPRWDGVLPPPPKDLEGIIG